MPARERKTQTVVNEREQPVEIHHGAETVVIPAGGSVRMPILPEADSAHLSALIERGLVRLEEPAGTGTATGARRAAKRGGARAKRSTGGGSRSRAGAGGRSRRRSGSSGTSSGGS